ncbi:MAG: GNAT family N-acetyltransferase [Nannocystaceae bacterium]
MRAERGASVRLVAPAVELRESFLSALREFEAEGLPWWQGPGVELAARDFAAFVADKLAQARRGADGAPAKTHLWAVADGRFVGRIAIFHGLTEALRVSGGHIGYDTVPSARGRGVATQMLRQALPVARGLGLREVLLTCDETNAASIRVIERCGGELRETRALAEGRPAKRYYWIALA